MKATDMSEGGAGADALAGVLHVSGAVEAAEDAVKRIRGELSDANATLTRAIQANHAAANSSRHTAEHARAVQDAHAVVAEIEARLRVAKERMTAAREKFAPRFAVAVLPWRHTAGAELDTAAAAIERALRIIGEVERFEVRHGLPTRSLGRHLPRPGDIRSVAARLQGRAQ